MIDTAPSVQRRWGIIGHQSAVEQLARSIENGNVSHAYLITGPEGVGRTALALAFARALTCERPLDERPCGTCASCRRITTDRDDWSHPDVLLADLEWQHQEFDSSRTGRTGPRQEFSIEAVRYLRQHIVTRPIQSRWKVQIIDAADRFSSVAPDALLKTLEEPPPFAVLILIAGSLDSVQETIRSRCRHVPLTMIPRGEIERGLIEGGFDPAEASERARRARGRAALAFRDTAGDDEHAELLEQALQHVSSPLARLELIGSIAGEHTRNRDKTYALLEIHLGIWRDILQIKLALDGARTYPEQDTMFRELADRFTVEELHRAVWATQRCLDDLDKSIQARIALNALVAQWP